MSPSEQAKYNSVIMIFALYRYMLYYHFTVPSLVKMMQDIGQYPMKFASVDKPKKNL